MSTLSQQQKDARERILVMAMMSGLTASDLTSIGGKIKRQQERAIVEGLSAQYHGIQLVKFTEENIVFSHNGLTISATVEEERPGRHRYDHRKFNVVVVGPKGGVKYTKVHSLRDYEIGQWPKKLMVKRSQNATVLAALILNQTIPTK